MKQKLTELKEELLFQINDTFDGIPDNPLLNLKGVRKEVTSKIEEMMDIFIEQNKEKKCEK